MSELIGSLQANFAGVYHDSGGGTVTITQTGNDVVATSTTAQWSPATGTVNGNSFSMPGLGVTGTLSSGKISWTNGFTWTDIAGK